MQINDKGDITLTPSSALQDEVAKRLLEAWEAVRGSEAGIGEFRAMVMQAKEQGVQFLGDGGSALLGPEMVRSPALRSELAAADRAYGASQAVLPTGAGVAALGDLIDREQVNPYVSGALAGLVRADAAIEKQIEAARESRERTKAREFLLQPEDSSLTRGAAQIGAAVLAHKRVQQKRENLREALSGLFVAQSAAISKLETAVMADTSTAQEIGQRVREFPEEFGEVRSFKAGFLGREDGEAKDLALGAAVRASREFAGTVFYYMLELGNAELVIAEQQASGIPAPSEDLAEALERTLPGANLFSGITQEDRRDRLISEAQTLVGQIGRRVDAGEGLGLSSQLVARLRDVQSRLKSARTQDRAHVQELEQRQDCHSLGI